MEKIRFPDYWIPKMLNRSCNKPVGYLPKRWEVWTFFTKELPLIWHDMDGKIYEIYTERNGKLPYPPKRWTRWIQLGDIYPSKNSNDGKLCLHPTVMVTDPIFLEKGEKISVFAFMTSNSRKKPIAEELLVENERMIEFGKGNKVSYVKPFNLWGEFAIPCDTLIEQRGELTCNPSEVIKKIRQFLLLDTPTWWKNTKYNIEELREAGNELGFHYGEPIVVTHPAKKSKIPGLIIGDIAITGREKLQRGWDPQVLFLRLVESDESDEDEDILLIPTTNLKIEGKPQSVVLTQFRVAPISSIEGWTWEDTENLKRWSKEEKESILMEVNDRFRRHYFAFHSTP